MILQVTKIYLLETFRNVGVLFGNLLPTFIFLGISFMLTKQSSIDTETLDYMIKGQFISFSVLMAIFSLAFSGATIYLSDKRSEKVFEWLNKTDLTFIKYFIGLGLGVFVILNIFLTITLYLYSVIIPIEAIELVKISIISNFTLLCLYPLSYIVSSVFRNGKTANSMLIPIMLILMFSVTMTNLFVSIAGNDPQDYYKYLVWNPMLFLNDTIQYNLGLSNEPWLPMYQYLAILLGLFVLLYFFAKRLFKI
ncbi:ABC transporter permease [Bacillus cereus]|uniref:ABC transporter permease protein n=3 Tax=Bacillaceae TaxID=186817 RepID=Q815M4_BACCR|nr:ABC transporter permease protein [Bacillus cereus ATCC 14579]ETT80139.1 ABC transporter permease [Bacillus cereus]KZD83368.1 ABC transporter permease protein [Bacillus cereus]OOR40195.1 ABC transporter permease [Bacillus cereus]OOR43929.1 ABC transporter permease [Bacillus cereus]